MIFIVQKILGISSDPLGAQRWSFKIGIHSVLFGTYWSKSSSEGFLRVFLSSRERSNRLRSSDEVLVAPPALLVALLGPLCPGTFSGPWARGSILEHGCIMDLISASGSNLGLSAPYFSFGLRVSRKILRSLTTFVTRVLRDSFIAPVPSDSFRALVPPDQFCNFGAIRSISAPRCYRNKIWGLGPPYPFTDQILEFSWWGGLVVCFIEL